MSGKLDRKRVFSLYLEQVISKAIETFPELVNYFLIDRAWQRRYMRVHAVFITRTEKMDVETEVETWFKIYKWIEDKKDEMLRELEAEKHVMIILYPRFINGAEFDSLSEADQELLEKKSMTF